MAAPASTGSILTWKKSVTRQNERLAERFRFSDRRATVMPNGQIGFESGRSLVIATKAANQTAIPSYRNWVSIPVIMW
jgi:hypothetical protein